MKSELRKQLDDEMAQSDSLREQSHANARRLLAEVSKPPGTKDRNLIASLLAESEAIGEAWTISNRKAQALLDQLEQARTAVRQ